MNNENTIRKSVQVISVIALIVIASGCATGGSKLDHDQLMTEIANSENTVKICRQYGAKMSCHIEDRNAAAGTVRTLQRIFSTVGR